MSEGAVVGKSVIVKLSGGRQVVCQELTVGQVRGLMQEMMHKPGDVVDELLLEEVRLLDLPLFTGLQGEELEAMLVSDLDRLVQGCKEANPSFFRMLAKVVSPLKQA